MSQMLANWNDTATRRAIVDFVERVTVEGGQDYVPPDERLAVFDNDGTLWCEKPMPIELPFIVQRLAEMGTQDPSLRDLQPWKAAHELDDAWLGEAITSHYHEEDSELKVLMGGILRAFADMTVETYATAADAFLHDGEHPTVDRAFRHCGYVPMLELLRYLEANGFTVFIVSGGDGDLMRPVTDEIDDLAEADVVNGRRPILAGGNSNGDIAMLEDAEGPSRPDLRLLLLHDDLEREFDYTAGAEDLLELACAQGWTVVSVKNDWGAVFADVSPATSAAVP